MSNAVKVGFVVLALIAVWWLAMSPPPERHDPAAVSGRGAMPVRALPPPAGRSAVAPAEATGAEPPKPAEPAAEPSAASAEEPAVAVNLPTRQGPVAELSQRFAGESRGPNSDADDQRVRAAFNDPAIPATLLHSSECRRSVCRVELRWAPKDDAAYVLGLTKAVGTFNAPVGIEAPGEPDAQGARPLVVYFGLAN